jgi:hypothetical protein
MADIPVRFSSSMAQYRLAIDRRGIVGAESWRLWIAA